MEPKQNNLSILNSFNEKCNKNNIWYSLSGLSLLDYQSKKNYSQKNIIEIFMTVDSYKKLLFFFHDNIIDSITKNNYFFTNPFYFEKELNEVIKINLLIKANIKKTEKYYSIKNLIRQKIGFYKSSNKELKGFLNSIKRTFYSFLNLFWSPLTWQEVCSNIYDDEYRGYFIIDSFSDNINKNWIPSITMEREQINWNDSYTYIFKEWNVFLNKRYGFDWQKKPIISNKKFDYFWINKIKH